VRPARVLLSETTRALVPDGFMVTGYEPMLLKGTNRLQPIYQLEIAVSAE
jgi:class 3 adenylate cyclase